MVSMKSKATIYNNFSAATRGVLSSVDFFRVHNIIVFSTLGGAK
jgi:hypothetical protein